MKVYISLPDNFVKVVNETAQWCALRASVDDPENCLRSTELSMPSPNMYIYDRELWTSSVRDHKQQFDMFAERLSKLIAIRRNYLAGKSHSRQMQGRLLVYHPTSSDSSGGSWVYSNKYFDVDDCPPWDTWICALHFERRHTLRPNETYEEFILLSWVPAVLYDVAEEGIRASPMECIYWLDSGSYPEDSPLAQANTIWRNKQRRNNGQE